MRFTWFVFRLMQKTMGWLRKVPIMVLTSCRHNKFKVLGKVYVWNPNIKLGKNVVLYPGVTLFGDGKIEICDNVVIGNGSIICASKEGGVYRTKYNDSRSMLYN